MNDYITQSLYTDHYSNNNVVPGGSSPSSK